MKKAFIKKTMVAAITHKATAAMPILRGENLDQKALDDFLREHDRKGGPNTLKLMAETDQDPQEIKEIFLEALEEAFDALKERALKNTEVVFNEVSKRVKIYAEQKNS